MAFQVVEYCPIAVAHSQGEAIGVEMLLDRIAVPYRKEGDRLFSIYGDAAAFLAGPIKFLVPKEMKEEAESRMMDLFTVDSCNLPSKCPACEAQVPTGNCDCPACGLFLG